MRVVIVAGAMILAAGMAMAAVHPAGDSALLHQDGFEGCDRAYLDLDADGFGHDVEYLCDPLPPLYVRVGGDCDDTDSSVYPGAFELEPDEFLRDENCDGVDGDASRAVFVAPDGSASPSCGSMQDPCTLDVAFDRAIALGKPHLYLAVGEYPGPVQPYGVTHVFGGFSADFSSRSLVGKGPETVIAGVAGSEPVVTALLLDATDMTLADMHFIAPDAAGFDPATGNGRSSYGIQATNANLTLRRSIVEAGLGGAGRAGVDGVDAGPATPEMDGGVGGDSVRQERVCDATNSGAGGSGGSNVCDGESNRNGGMGGDGGTMDTSCSLPPNVNARPGRAGSQGWGPFPGTGGAGGSTCGGSTGEGRPGVSGADGPRGTASLSRLTIVGQVVLAGTGGDGKLGGHGSGGGGGGGSGGCDTGTDAYGAGGGGGGAGGCRATVPGTGGSGGGSSIGIALFSSTLHADDVDILTAGGGKGGAGGAGGAGQPGGTGAAGGDAVATTRAGGKGGNGGRGGHTGGGAGGNGGHSIGILQSESDANVTYVYFWLGPAGDGGDGGAAAPGGNDGSQGAGGFKMNMRDCTGGTC